MHSAAAARSPPASLAAGVGHSAGLEDARCAHAREMVMHPIPLLSYTSLSSLCWLNRTGACASLSRALPLLRAVGGAPLHRLDRIALAGRSQDSLATDLNYAHRPETGRDGRKRNTRTTSQHTWVTHAPCSDRFCLEHPENVHSVRVRLEGRAAHRPGATRGVILSHKNRL